MKKHLFFAFTMMGTFLFAQVNKNVNSQFLKPVLNSNPIVIENINPVQVEQQRKRFTQSATQSVCPGVIFTHGPNAYSTGADFNTFKQSCLTYNQDLNAVLWIHRASKFWNFSGYTSGAIQATWLNVSTGLWDSTIIYRDSANQNGGRYPGGVFYNPIGNTNFANAYAVGVGPTAMGSWTGIFYSARQISGNYHQVSAAQDDNNLCLYGTAPFGYQFNSGQGYGLMNADMQQAGNTIFVGGGLSDKTYTLSAGNQQYGGTIGKATNLNWSSDTLVPGFYLSPNGYSNDEQGLRIAFSPNGQIGYAVFIGRLATAYGNNSDSTYSPIVYKTTNGGTSWSSIILPGFDWAVGHPELFRNVGYNVFRNHKARQFRFYNNHGMDLTVDSLGTLHLVGTMTDPYIGSPGAWSVDSLTYGYTYNWDYRHSRPIIWDLMTDGTNWNTLLVDSILSSHMGPDPANDTTAVYNPWSGNGVFLGYGARIQVGRSTTGGKIFYSWADSDSLLTGTLYNTNPDIHVKSYDISNQMVTPSFNATQGLGECFFHYMSNISYYDNIQNGWVCPIVYTTPYSQTSPYNGADTVNYKYFNCALITGSQYTDSASVYRTQGGVGIATHNSVEQALTKNYPNPFSQTTNIVVTLKQSKAIDLKVYDVLGNVVYTNTKKGNVGENTFVFDGTTLQAGVYYYTVSIDGEKSTRKMVLQK